jgi:hypothetical protein
MLTFTLAALLPVLAACGGDSASKTTPGPAQPDPGDLVTKAAERLNNVRSFHFVLAHENGTSPIVMGLSMKRAEGDMVLPDRLRADIGAVATRLGGVNVQVQFVAVGENAKITNPFDRTQWVSLPGQSPLADIFDPAAGSIAALRAVQNPRLVGEDKIEGTPVWAVTGDLDAETMQGFIPVAEKGYRVKGTAWIGADDPLVYRIRLDGPFGSADPANIVRTVELSRFDKPVSIELP